MKTNTERLGANMDELVSFVKEILMLSKSDVMPVGLCAFETNQTQPIKKVKTKRKSELRLSELMNK